jgi:hypothetical protein
MIIEIGNIKLIKFFRLIIKDIIKGERIKPYGVWMYVGLGGSGKTISMIEYLERMKKKHKGIKIYTNFEYKNQDGRIRGWRDLIDIKDDNGVIFGFDEISGTFNAKEWKNFPYEIFTLLCQSRKMNKQIVCTAQSYDDVDVAIRRKCNYIIECKCLMGRWIFNKAFLRNEYERGEDHLGRKKRRLRAWRYSFVAGDELRNMYDTYEQVELMLEGDHTRE